eukprot:s63_g5.t1
MVLQHDGRITVQTHHKHVDQLCSLLELNKRLQNKRTPGHCEMDRLDVFGEFSPEKACALRTCVGILLFLATDLPHCQRVVRHLSCYSTQPTVGSMVILKHMVSYLACHEDICVSLRWRGRSSGRFHQYGCAAEYARNFHRQRLGKQQRNPPLNFLCYNISLWLPVVFIKLYTEVGVPQQCRSGSVCMQFWFLRWIASGEDCGLDDWKQGADDPGGIMAKKANMLAMLSAFSLAQLEPMSREENIEMNDVEMDDAPALLQREPAADDYVAWMLERCMRRRGNTETICGQRSIMGKEKNQMFQKMQSRDVSISKLRKDLQLVDSIAATKAACELWKGEA